MKIPLLCYARISIAALLCSASIHVFAATADHISTKRSFNLPPSAELNYAIRARQSGLSINGDAVVKWQTDGHDYSVEATTRAMILGKILEAKSDGKIDDYGLSPTQFTDKRFHKNSTTTTFNRDTNGGTITFSPSDASYPIIGGEQDRTSIVWQLVAVARAAKKQFKPGSDWVFFVAGQRDAEPWTFKVINQEKITTGMGEVEAIHIFREPPPDATEQRLDIWLAPSLEWYPIRIRFTDPNNDFVDQTLDKITK
ncbi:DUF3108 domain-containing protein [Glaciimonas sp. PAMC28666]|uniref:DUF3108 domain-containing protein n=1 Tax=Glaciimonas sp. PAMC28666 TaxID=2807626 RepID=UPI00196385C0|nr:DUF3108 domain-containing protein [Glaciimonas sp. PAMC28666]QRX83946.1 DUF3108 domain-containing protein [Glaciimonas sp. PAMC28666]